MSVLLRENYQLERIGEFIAGHRNILAPICRIPPEILQEIFVYVADAYHDINHYPGSHHDSRWTIAKVCRFWRSSALSLSTLWSRLDIMLPDISRTRTSGPVDLIAEHLRRSRNAPLDIMVGDFSSGAFDRSEEPIMTLLLSHCEQWRRLVMGTVAVETIAAFRQAKGRLPVLEYLSLNISQDPSNAPLNDSMLDIFKCAPRLRTVSIMGWSCTREFVLPFSQLIRYETSAPTVSFAKLTQLHTLSLKPSRPLTDIFYGSAIYAATFPVTFQNLSKLILHVDFSNDSKAMRSIRLPSIREIHVFSSTRTLCSDLVFAISHTPSPCLLMILDLEAPTDTGDLLALLSVTPVLIELQALISDPNDICALTPTENKDILVPLLERCTFAIPARALNDAMRHAVTRFASLRCDMIDRVTNQKFQRLKILQVEDSDEPFLQQADFEPWRDTEPMAEIDHLDLFKTAIQAEVPASYSPKLGNARQLRKILTEIEEYEIMDVKALLRSDLHAEIRWRFCANDVDSSDPISKHAHRILDKWSILVEPILQDIHWLMAGDGYIVRQNAIFLAHDHPIRSRSKDAIHYIMYADEDEEKDIEADLGWIVFQKCGTFL